MMASHCPEAQGKSIKRAVLTESLLQVWEGPGYRLPTRLRVCTARCLVADETELCAGLAVHCMALRGGAVPISLRLLPRQAPAHHRT